MSLPGVNYGNSPDPSQRTSFRSSWTQPEGAVAAHILEAKVVDLNLKLWTVDVISQFDQKQFLNIQVGSPYMHSNNGEGIYAMPDLGAKCHVCIPSDGPPPFVLDFIMPQETVPQAGTTDAPEGTDGSRGDGGFEPTESTFAGGRVRAKPGDIIAKGRNGNFVILHKGGVLQIGATELAQRIYIPLQNLVSDISQTYRHYNTGGSINWYLASGESETNPSTIRKDTFRLLAGDEKASIRVAYGPLKDFVPEPGSGAAAGLAELGIGTSDPIVMEVVLAPEGFGANDGSVDGSTPGLTKLRYFFDKGGNTFLRSEGSVLLSVRKKFRLVAQDDIEFRSSKSIRVVAGATGRFQAEDLLELSARVTKINGGSKPVATVGSLLEARVVLPLVGLPAAPGANVIIPPINPLTGQPQILQGNITTGNSTILG